MRLSTLLGWPSPYVRLLGLTAPVRTALEAAETDARDRGDQRAATALGELRERVSGLLDELDGAVGEADRLLAEGT